MCYVSMPRRWERSIFQDVDFHPKINNTEHRTSEISERQLIVRRGQAFTVTLRLYQPLNGEPLIFTARTGKHASEDRGTLSLFTLPESVNRSPTAKAVWRVGLDGSSSPANGILKLAILPPPETPLGKWNLMVRHRDQDRHLATLTVLFNPWCPDDAVFLDDEDQRQEYVMNEQGVVYQGSGNYILGVKWDYGQFEEDMTKICLKLLDLNLKHLADPADDDSARCNVVYVSRVVSAMINSAGDRGVIAGNWSGSYDNGVNPTRWNGSHAILNKWLQSGCHPVKYGQCWVFAAVMCSVLRLLGIPCRTVTNFQSAHDTNKNLTIDVYRCRTNYGVREKESADSIWNFHVWVEAWMKRPDLAVDGSYDGWQVLDPTPQEKSNGVFCLGPTSVKAILKGNVDLMYDTPFVFAEVNADHVVWLVNKDSSETKISSDTKKVGQYISTKAVGSEKRSDITNTYKYREGTLKERSVFEYALNRDYSEADGSGDTDEEEEEENETVEDGGKEPTPDDPQLKLRFKEVSKPRNGKDVKLKLVLNSQMRGNRPVSIGISVQAMTYNGRPFQDIQYERLEKMLQFGKDVSVSIVVPFSAYSKAMLHSDSMKVTAVVIDNCIPNGTYLAEDDIVLLDPPISVSVSGVARINQETMGQLVFTNPVQETLEKCTLTLSGSGLWRDPIEIQIADMKPNTKLVVKFPFVPYKAGLKTLMADFDCSLFRDITCSCTFKVEHSPYIYIPEHEICYFGG